MSKKSVVKAILENIGAGGTPSDDEELDKVVPDDGEDEFAPDATDETGRDEFAPDANMTIKDDEDELPPEPQEKGGLSQDVIDVMAAGKARVAGVTAEDVDPKELEMGLEVEKEHTDDPRVAEMIALDHLTEIADYYTRLKAMEDEAKAEQGKASEGPREPEPSDDDEEGWEDFD